MNETGTEQVQTLIKLLEWALPTVILIFSGILIVVWYFLKKYFDKIDLISPEKINNIAIELENFKKKFDEKFEKWHDAMTAQKFSDLRHDEDISGLRTDVNSLKTNVKTLTADVHEIKKGMKSIITRNETKDEQDG